MGLPMYDQHVAKYAFLCIALCCIPGMQDQYMAVDYSRQRDSFSGLDVGCAAREASRSQFLALAGLWSSTGGHQK